MALNSIKLHPHQLQEWFGNVLIERVASPVPEAEVVPFTGENAQRILVLVDKPSSAFLPEAELLFFTNVLGACKLTINDVAIVNKAHLTLPMEAVFAQLQPLSVLLFAVPPLQAGLPVHFPHYQAQPFDGRTYFSAPSLTELEADMAEKKKFWVGLKKLFGV